MTNVIYVLKERGLVDATTSEALAHWMETPRTLYLGFDPTANSLHLGHLVGIIVLAWFKKYGHTPVALVGGATGMIGDPSGKSVERNLLNEEAVEENVLGIRRSLEAVLKEEVPILNNSTWFGKIGYVDFLRDIGKYFRLGSMIAKESVKQRLASQEGISYTEFSYQLLQAYDFLHLYETEQITLQLGGSDQWGNITAGIELVRKVANAEVYGLTFPLLTRSDGKKFGKSEGGAIWLNADKRSPYDFYQYLFAVPDLDVIKMLRMLTFLDLEEISAIEASMQRPDYQPNRAQKRLAEEVTRLVHGAHGLEEAERVTQAAQPGSQVALDGHTLHALAADLPSKELARSEVVGVKLVELLVTSGLASSKGEARRMIIGGGVYVNNERVVEEHYTVEEREVIEGKYLLISVGKKRRLVLFLSPGK